MNNSPIIKYLDEKSSQLNKEDERPFLTTYNFFIRDKDRNKISPSKNNYNQENPKFIYHAFKKMFSLNENFEEKERSQDDIKLIKVNVKKRDNKTPIKQNKEKTINDEKYINKIKQIQKWWRPISSIIKIQKNIRKYLSKVKLFKLKIEKKYIKRWFDITYKRIILTKLNIYNFEKILKGKNNQSKRSRINRLKKIKIYKESNKMNDFYKNSNSLEKRSINFLSYSKNSNTNSFSNKIPNSIFSNSYYLDTNQCLTNRSNNSKNKSNSKIKNMINVSQERIIPKKNTKIIRFHKEQKVHIVPFDLKKNYKKRNENKNAVKYNNNSYSILKYQTSNNLNKKEILKYKKRLELLINLKKCYGLWKSKIEKIKINKMIIKHLLLKKCLLHFHFILYGKIILKKLIFYKKNSIIKQYFISNKKKIIKNALHSLSNWKKLKTLFYKYKSKIFKTNLIKIFYKIKKNNYNNNVESLFNKTTEYKKNNIINNININNYFNNSKCINFNDIQYNNYFNVQIPSGVIKKNKSCEKRKYKKNNVSIYRKQNNSTEKRMINKIEGEIKVNDINIKEKEMLLTLHSYSLNKTSITFVKNNSFNKLNKLLEIYSKFLGKKQMTDNFKKWKEKSNERDNNNNDDKKIINKRIKLNDKLIKMIKNSNNNSKVNNNVNDKLLLSDNKKKIYHRKKVHLNIEDVNNSKNIYCNENNKINVASNPNEIINNKENQFFLTERKITKFDDASKDENKCFKQNFIEEKEIHFVKRKINI